MRCTMAGEKRAHWLHSASYCAAESAVSPVTYDREVLHTRSGLEISNLSHRDTESSGSSPSLAVPIMRATHNNRQRLSAVDGKIL